MMIELLFYHAPTLAALRGGRYRVIPGLVAHHDWVGKWISTIIGSSSLDSIQPDLKQLAFSEIGPARTTMEEQITWHVLTASRC